VSITGGGVDSIAGGGVTIAVPTGVRVGMGIEGGPPEAGAAVAPAPLAAPGASTMRTSKPMGPSSTCNEAVPCAD
jgi:hypothetical protein